MAKRFVDNDKNSSIMRTAINKQKDLNVIMRALFDASDSDFIMHDDQHVTLIFPTVHQTRHGWDLVDGSRAKASDLGGFTLRMIDRLADQTDIVDMWYPKDGHVGIHFNKDALRNRLDSDILDDMNARNGFNRYVPRWSGDFAAWAAGQMNSIIF